MEPENVTAEEILSSGTGLCSGYVPFSIPGVYMEIWQYNGYVYAITVDKETVVHKLSICWRPQ